MFARKTDVKHIFNASWTRGTKIPRQVQGVTHWFDPFCPKVVVGLLGMQLPRTLVGRSIMIKLRPKRPAEKVETFAHADDEEFTNLRRKSARWAADNCLVGRPSVVLLDEPSEGIQPSIVEEIARHLHDLSAQQKLAILLVEQDLQFVASIAQRVYVMRKGRLVSEMAPLELMDPAIVKEQLGI